MTLTCGACGAGAHAPVASAASTTLAAEPPCAQPGQAAATAVEIAAIHIYALELSSSEVTADRKQVEGYAPLLEALAAGNREATRAAVESLVFSHTHVVRLRVSSQGNVIADIGGPYILAPVAGTLRLHGRVVGRYVLSVQDDLGYVKLATRFVGAPLILRVGGGRLPIEGTLPEPAAGLPESGPVMLHGDGYEAVTITARAFPTGRLRITILVAPPHVSAAAGCGAVMALERLHIGERVWRRYQLAAAPPSAFIHELHSLTDALGYVRAGSRQLAGSTQPGPGRLPDSGAVLYRGRTYRVQSFPSRAGGHRVRVYMLLAA